MPSAKLKNMLQYSDRLSTVFGALADPSRRAIVARLTKGSATVSELARPLPMSLSAVGQHLKVLTGAGLLRATKIKGWVFYRRDEERIAAAKALLGGSW